MNRKSIPSTSSSGTRSTIETTSWVSLSRLGNALWQLAQPVEICMESFKGDGANTIRQRISVLANMDQVQSSQLEIRHSDAHRFRELRSNGMFELKSQSFLAPDNEQVQFRPLMRSPEKAFTPVCS